MNIVRCSIVRVEITTRVYNYNCKFLPGSVTKERRNRPDRRKSVYLRNHCGNLGLLFYKQACKAAWYDLTCLHYNRNIFLNDMLYSDNTCLILYLLIVTQVVV